jgi:hypothetical protein
METATTTTIKPQVGMSVTEYIGSDSYHEIIVDITRNGRSVMTMDASKVLGGVSVEQWEATPIDIRAHRARAAWIDLMHGIINRTADDDTANRWIETIRRQNTYTLRKDGQYVSQGSKYGRLKLNSTYAHLDPSF